MRYRNDLFRLPALLCLLTKKGAGVEEKSVDDRNFCRKIFGECFRMVDTYVVSARKWKKLSIRFESRTTAKNPRLFWPKNRKNWAVEYKVSHVDWHVRFQKYGQNKEFERKQPNEVKNWFSQLNSESIQYWSAVNRFSNCDYLLMISMVDGGVHCAVEE